MKHNLLPKRFTKKKDKAYFASKSELLTWVSTTLNLEIKSIEETQTGAIFCQLLDAAHPGTIRMNKVNWKAKLETEYISNFKLFQEGLIKNNIQKPINIQRLSKGKNQELIELLQWLYGHHIELGIDSNNYDAIKKRNGNNFIYYGQKMTNINAFNKNNFGIRDDISSNSNNNNNDYKDFFGVKNNLKNKINTNSNYSNINSLNADLRSNNFHTAINNNNKNNKNKIQRGKSEKISMNTSRESNSSISPSPNPNLQKKFSEDSYKNKSSTKNEELSSNKNTYNINMNEITRSSFVIEEKPEDEEKLNNILFEGISNIDKENILELEKHDGNNILNLKILIRKLRISNIIFKTNLGSILNKVTKERDFFLNKLKDIEYLYFNPIIRNNNENKNMLLKSILKSDVDSTILINNEGFASIKNIYNNKNDDIIINPKNNSQNVMRIKLAYSKNNNKKETDINENNENVFNNIYNNNKTQPILSETNLKKFESNIFPLKNDLGFDNCNNNSNNNSNNRRSNHNHNHVTPSTKTAFYDISSHILNESLHLHNTENANPNMNNDNSI
jgi:RP/EB family microtubule-associated protein